MRFPLASLDQLSLEERNTKEQASADAQVGQPPLEGFRLQPRSGNTEARCCSTQGHERFGLGFTGHVTPHSEDLIAWKGPGGTVRLFGGYALIWGYPSVL